MIDEEVLTISKKTTDNVLVPDDAVFAAAYSTALGISTHAIKDAHRRTMNTITKYVTKVHFTEEYYTTEKESTPNIPLDQAEFVHSRWTEIMFLLKVYEDQLSEANEHLLRNRIAVKAFLLRLKLLANNGKVGKGLDLIYDEFQTHLRRRDFDFAESVFRNAEARSLNIDLKLGLVVVSYPWRKSLIFRDPFVLMIKNELYNLHGQEEGLKIIQQWI